jgi:class 3 adenylate cyclase
VAEITPAMAPSAGPDPVAERRVCSVVFCDVVGFTPLSESLDPEAVRELLTQYFAVARTVIGRYGGVVEKFIGDAVMAVWGTPAATEGDAERAVRAALDLVATVAALGAEARVPGLAARVGVVTGEVAVSLGAVGEGMVAGDAVNTAARVQSVAAPGQVLVDAATHRLAGGAVGFAEAGSHQLKGKTEPQELWRATRVLAGVGGVQRVDGLEAPLTGRDAELRTIKDMFHAIATGGCRGWCWCPARPGWENPGWAGSSRSTRTVWPRRCGGTAAGACPTARAWRSGPWPRSSGSGSASPRRISPRSPRPSCKTAWTGSCPTPPNGPTPGSG